MLYAGVKVVDCVGKAFKAKFAHMILFNGILNFSCPVVGRIGVKLIETWLNGTVWKLRPGGKGASAKDNEGRSISLD